MPIIEIPNDDAPLSQGDILTGVPMFCTALGHEGHTPERAPFELCLVLSRPCNLLHRPNAIVAAVSDYKVDKPATADTFGKVLDFLTNMRDGNETPDVFYLGHLPGRTGRFGCRFDAIFTVRLPPLGDERSQFLERHRIGVLSASFVRDLHTRLFRAFASLGFDDHGWFCNEDLKWLVAKGREDLNTVDQELGSAKRAKAEVEASGKEFSSKGIQAIEKKEKVRAQIAADLQPFADELRRRGIEGD